MIRRWLKKIPSRAFCSPGLSRLGMAALALGFMLLVAPPALAEGIPDGTCTTDPQFEIVPPAAGDGIVSIIIRKIKCILYAREFIDPICNDGQDSIAQRMFETIAADDGFVEALSALLTLYIIVYGILFTFGMVNLTILDFVIRMVKFSIVAALLQPGAWDFFSGTVVHFFDAGTDELMSVMMRIGMGIVAGIDPRFPFAIIDNALVYLVSARMAVTIMALIFTGPYGFMFFLLLMLGIGTFLAALFQTVWIYLMAIVVRTLLFGLAPLFLSFLLFSRTRHLFEGWLNQLVNTSLQPIFLFTFFAFFAKLIEAMLYRILRIPVCWTPPGQSVEGTPLFMHYWRFTWEDSFVANRFYMYGGNWTFTGVDNPNPLVPAPVFPVDVLDILIFLILSQIAWRFNTVVISVAKEIASASTSLNMTGALGRWFSPGGITGGTQQMSSSAIQRAREQQAGAAGGAARAQAGGGVERPGGAQRTNPAPAGLGGAAGIRDQIAQMPGARGSGPQS